MTTSQRSIEEETPDSGGTATSRGSGAVAQPGENERDETASRGLGRQAVGRCEGVEAVARELLGCDIVPYDAGACALAQQVSYYLAELLLRSGDVLILMNECREFGAVVPVGLVGDECVSLQYGFETFALEAVTR